MIDQFGRKWYQKKLEDVGYKLIWEFFQKWCDVHELQAVKY